MKLNSTEVVVETEQGIMWKNGLYKKVNALMDADYFLEIYEKEIKKKESRIEKMKKAIWILVGVIFTLANTLLCVLI